MVGGELEIAAVLEIYGELGTAGARLVARVDRHGEHAARMVGGQQVVPVLVVAHEVLLQKGDYQIEHALVHGGELAVRQRGGHLLLHTIHVANLVRCGGCGGGHGRRGRLKSRLRVHEPLHFRTLTL